MTTVSTIYARLFNFRHLDIGRYAAASEWCIATR